MECTIITIVGLGRRVSRPEGIAYQKVAITHTHGVWQKRRHSMHVRYRKRGMSQLEAVADIAWRGHRVCGDIA